MKNNERMEKLDNAGIDTSKYFNIKLPDGLKPGSTISVIIDENGNPVLNSDTANEIIKNGYVRNTKLYRRFVMAQMFRMLNYRDYKGNYIGYSEYLNRYYSYNYTFNMMKDEISVLYQLEVGDFDTFKERRVYFTKERISAVIDDYVSKLTDYIKTLKTKKCKGVPYKTIRGENVFESDIFKKVINPIIITSNRIKSAENYGQITNIYKGFMRTKFIKLPFDTRKSSVWIDTFKGEGAFYTLKNLIMYHNCFLYNKYGRPVFDDFAMNILNELADKYKDEGWRLFAFMKKTIEDNNFDFDKRMREVYAEKRNMI